MRVLLLLAAVLAATSAKDVEVMRLTVPTHPSYSLEKWEQILASQDLKEEVCIGCKRGTKPQSPSAGVVPSSQSLRIINGQFATEGQFPWQAAITMDNSYLCGGSVISERFILTAGHCVFGFRTWNIVLGDTSRQYATVNTIVVNTYKSILHDGFDKKAITNDIGLLQLLFPISYNPDVKAVKLPSAADAANTFVGESATVSGFGKTSDSSSSSSSYRLKFVSQPIMSNKKCARYFGEYVRDYNICGDGAGNVGSCNGDSGGALVHKTTQGSVDVWTQIGIVSYGSSAGCTLSQPSVYTRVTSFLKWIQDNTGIQV